MEKLTPRQRDVLGVVESAGPVSVHDVGQYHLHFLGDSARGILNRLEARGLIEARYELHYRWNRFIREYVITREGAAALAANLEAEEET